MAALDHEVLQNELKKKRICRFCLTQDVPKITNIYMRDTRIKSSAPLPIQIMAIASIEVFSNDGMPPFVCSDCTNLFEYSYQFKQMCKKADNLLRQFPLTGKWPESLQKPIMQTKEVPHNVIQPNRNTKTTQVRMQHFAKPSVQQESLLLPKKILNSSVATKSTGGGTNALNTDSPLTPKSERHSKIIVKVEKADEDCSITLLDKIDNNDELSMDDIHQLVAAEDVYESKLNIEKLTVKQVNTNTKPKLLNKSSIRILNKNAEPENEPRLSLPKVKTDVDGKTEIVAEILNINDIHEDEADPKNATVIETNVFPCNFCERTFPLLQLRDIHLRNHSRDRKFPCPDCDKSFFSKYDLQRHSFLHNGEKPFKCSVCNKAFSRSSLLTRHEKSHTDVPKHICIHCERSFLSKDDMQRHIERHKIKRPFVCKICNKRFAFKQGLERHEVVHSRQQPYKCHYCEQSFSTTSKLSRHLTAHAGLRPFPCKFCKKSYLLSHHLTRHLRSHKYVNDSINAISFMCMRCNTSFASRDELIIHSTTHANEMNLACPLCKDVFTSMTELTSHIQDHSEGEAYACEFCDLIFMTAEKLQSHTDIDHSQEMEAYYADDRAQADKLKLENMEDSDEKLQTTVSEFFSDELSNEEDEPEKPAKKTAAKETVEEPAKVVTHQIINKNAANIQNDKGRQVEENKSLLIPLKQRKINIAGKSVITQTKVPERTPQLRRKIPNATVIPAARAANQPSIDSLLKLPKTVTVSKTLKTPPSKAPPPSKTPPSKTLPSKTPPSKTSPSKLMVAVNALLPPKEIKVEKEGPVTKPLSSTFVEKDDDGIAQKKIDPKKIKVQKITVTKAQAAAMAKEGRIKIKDGKIILKK